jgi:hypothetical protein
MHLTWDVFAYTTLLSYTHEAWCGRVRASTDLAGLDKEKIAEFSADLLDVLQCKFKDHVLRVDHKVFCLIATASDANAQYARLFDVTSQDRKGPSAAKQRG